MIVLLMSFHRVSSADGSEAVRIGSRGDDPWLLSLSGESYRIGSLKSAFSRFLAICSGIGLPRPGTLLLLISGRCSGQRTRANPLAIVR